MNRPLRIFLPLTIVASMMLYGCYQLLDTPRGEAQWKSVPPQAAIADADVPPNGNPADWACKETLSPVSPERIANFCRSHPKNPPDCEKNSTCTRGTPVQWPAQPATLGDLEAKNEFDLWYGEWLTSRVYSESVADGGLGWLSDRNWRLTGPIVGELCSDRTKSSCSPELTTGYLNGKNLESYGVHPAVRIYYSPEAIDWLCDGREGKIADGGAIIKEMSGFDGLAVSVDGNRCMTIVEEPEVTGWAPWVRANDVSYDGWYWGGGVSGGNPPILDRSAAVSEKFGNPAPTSPDPHWYPTGNFAGEPNVVYPYNLYAAYCVNCHASAKSNLTFSSMDNILEAGIEYKLYPPQPASEQATLHELSPAAHGDTPDPSNTVPSRAPYATPLAEPEESFLEFYDQIPRVDFATAWDSRLPAETFDHVFPEPHGPGQFLTSDQCIGCHDATNSNSSTANMLFPIDGQGSDYEYVNLSPYATWRVSPMGLAGRDPIFFSQLQSETNNLPQYAACIENTCLHCHGVMGQRQLGIDTEGPAGDECKDLFPIAPPPEVAFGTPFRLSMVVQYQDSAETPHAKYGNLARDGISCTVCHHISEESLGEEATFTGNFVAGPGDEVYGPYATDTVVPRPMQNALGITPVYGEQTTESDMCSTCHNILLPIFANDGSRRGASYEQTTGLEWQNSEFSKWGTDTFRSCQDCHMRTEYDGQPLKAKIANIESADFAPTTERLPDAEITLTERDRFPRHTLAGLNVFINEMFQQFPVLLGLRQNDYMLAKGVKPGLLHGRDAIIEIAREATASVAVDSLERTADGQLNAVVTVTNEGGHYLPSGVGFRRVFVDFRVKDAHGNDLWASGRTDDLGVIVRGLTGERLASEQPVAFPRAYQPHYQVITSDDQVQIYQELIKDSDGDFTTSFLRRIEDVKDNRLRPRGYDPAFYTRNFTSKYIRALAQTHGRAKDDPYFTDPALTGADRVEYRVSLDAATLAQVDHVEVRLYNQSIPPGYLQQRFRDANRGPGERSEIQRLFYLTSHLDVQATDGRGQAFIDDWKLELACGSKALAGSTAAACR